MLATTRYAIFCSFHVVRLIHHSIKKNDFLAKSTMMNQTNLDVTLSFVMSKKKITFKEV